MTDYALDALLAPIDEAEPTGPDLEYDADFMAFERAAAPKAERVIGDEVKAAEEPDWDQVAETAVALLRRSKDLRVATPLSVAWLCTSGMPGWAAGMALIRGLLENFWDGVHPQLDAEDNDDPTARVNAVVPIADAQGALGYLHSAPFVQSPRLGLFSLRDLRIANGELKPPAPSTGGEEGGETSAPASLAEIEACCMDCPEEELAATIEAVNASMEHVQAIDQLFTDRIGTLGPDLKPLLADLTTLQKFLGEQMAKRQPETAEGEAAEGASADGAPAAKVTGRINGPQDVVRRIDEICDYYARAEPSSPVPLLLRRAQRLVGLSFADLLQDLTPSGVSELQVISGNAPEE